MWVATNAEASIVNNSIQIVIWRVPGWRRVVLNLL